MKTLDLLVSNLNITEDEYLFKGPFTLSSGELTMDLDITDIDIPEKLDEIKSYFNLEEDTSQINKILFNAVLEKAGISSVIKEGKDLVDEPNKKTGNLDMA